MCCVFNQESQMSNSQGQASEREWAIVTGASSGLGVAFARALARQGYNLVLVARREQPMRDLAGELEEIFQIRVVVESWDLCDPDSAVLPQEHLGESIKPTVLVNNAAFAVSGLFLEQDPDRLRAMLQLNIIALTDLTHVFGRQMVEHGKGHILLVASVGAYTPSPFAAAYSAAKFYVLSLGVALDEELGPDVRVSVLSPGLMETEFHEVAGYTMKPSMRRSVLPPDKVAEIGLNALFNGRSSVVAGKLNAIG
ncbi:MAG: SDR family oxidoreductase, partial [Verrucomicrobiaceae bacterium]